MWVGDCVFVHQQIPDSRLFVVVAFVVAASVSWGQIYEYRLYRMCVDIMALALALAFALAFTLALPLNCFSAHQLYYALIIDAQIYDSATAPTG